MHQGVVGDAVVEIVQLFLVGQVAIDEEVSHLHERCLFRQIFNGVTTVAQDPIFAVQVGDATLCGSRVLEPWVQGDVSRGATKLGDVNGLFIFRPSDDREFVFLSVQNDACGLTHGFAVREN